MKGGITGIAAQDWPDGFLNSSLRCRFWLFKLKEE